MRGDENPSAGATADPTSTLHVRESRALSLAEGPTTVLAHGCFDLLHAGHIEHLMEAKKLGDRLVVSITGDEFVGKGAWRPYYSAKERASHLRALRFVDAVEINDARSAIPMIERVRPDIYVKGIDYDGVADPELNEEIAAVGRCGGRFHATSNIKQSSSRILAKLQHGDAVAAYLETCRVRGFWPRIAEAFDKARALHVCFIGETIIDEYRYVSALGKANKEFVLAVTEHTKEEFKGGVVAAARHADKLCKVSVVTQLREKELRKTRYIGQDFGHKLFEVYSGDRLPLSEDDHRKFKSEIKAAKIFADVVVALDFGHGLIDHEAICLLHEVKFLAVNAQTNAGNYGYNSVAKYAHANYVCVDAPELRLATHEQHAPIDGALHKLSAMMCEPKHLIVTHGKEGSYWRGGRVPAFATTPKDTIGAGDCFLAVTAPLIAAGLGDEEAALVGNVAGAMKTEIVGHRAPIDADVLYQSVKSLLK